MESAPRPDDEGLDDERVFDEYLERALRGDAPEPASFVRERGGSARLQQALERVHRRAPTSTNGDALPFEQLGEFRLIRRLGGGGMGVVFAAEQQSLGREVALKIVRPELQASAVAAERFDREARAIAQLRHPNIVAVHGAGVADGVRYLAMELVDGSSLDELIRRDELATLPFARRVRWIADLARALDYAHGRGVIHRDVKPSNIRIAADGRALLLDFGLARMADSAGATLTDAFAGSPSYASPEQISKSSAVDARTDVYSLGVTLYQCLTGVVPFRGATVEQVFHRILSAEPVPPRRIDATIPRDLETVVLQAIERDVARRYGTAAAFADDLEAVLELRPIRGRRPGALERARRAGRRHPALAGAILVAGISIVGGLAAWIAQGRLRVVEARAEAERTIEAARAKVAAYRESRESLVALKARVDKLRQDQIFNFIDDAELAVLDANEAQVTEAEHAWEATFHEVLDLLRYAERLDPDTTRTDAVRAELYYERYDEARDASDSVTSEIYARLVLEHDRTGDFESKLAGEAQLTVTSDPPGAQIHLFEWVEHARLVDGGDPRMVPVPFGDPTPAIAPGTWSLRVLADAGELQAHDVVFEVAGEPIEDSMLVLTGPPPLLPGDRLVAIDGDTVEDLWSAEHLGASAARDANGVRTSKRFAFRRGPERFELEGGSLAELGVRAVAPWEFVADRTRPAVRARAHRNGELLDLELPPGLEARASATPLFTSPRCVLGTTPIAARGIPSGSYLIVARLAGHEEARFAFSALAGVAEVHLDLHAIGTTPAGFVFVDGGTDRFWIQERETTAAEYLEFVNAPESRALIASSRKPVLVPRQSVDTEAGPLWFVGASGAYELPADWRPDWPVFGISWHDAQAYAAWRTTRARESGLPWTFRLPTFAEFTTAGHGRVPWAYTWGLTFRAKWARTCFARPSASPGPVMQFPVDQSPFGVFDLCGSAFEWLDHWYDEERGLRHLGGGAWGQSLPSTIRLWGGYGAPSDATSGETGVRLVSSIDGEGAR